MRILFCACLHSANQFNTMQAYSEKITGACMGRDESKAVGGKARADALTAEQRKEIASKAANARWKMPQAIHTGTLKLGDIELPCAVLSDESRVLTETDFMQGMGMYRSGALSVRRQQDEDGAQVPLYLAFKNLKPYIEQHLGDVHELVLKYRTGKGSIAHGIRADIIPNICDVWLDAQEDGVLGERQKRVADKAKLIMRGLAHTGIVALVDEATGYQYERAPNALAKILEAFIAKELQPWVKTFPDEYYEQLFRLRGIAYSETNVKRPQYFGHLTNDIIYKRLAPKVLEELKRTTPRTPRGKYKNRLHQHLTPDLGHPKLRELMASVVTIMKMTEDYDGFKEALDRIHPAYNETMSLEFDDTYKGL